MKSRIELKLRVGLYTFIILSVCSLGAFGQTKRAVGIVDVAVLTLSESPQIQRNKLTVNNAEGNFRIQKSAFDYRLSTSAFATRNSLNLLSVDPRNTLTDGTLNTQGSIFSLGVSKRFRTGLITDLSVNYNSLNDNFSLNRFNEAFMPNITDHFMTSSLTLTQPLMRGRGTIIATALEQSATLNLQSSRKNLTFVNSAQILEATTAYWQYLTAHNEAQIFQQNESRVRRMLEITQELVDGDKRAKGDLAQVRADLANQERLNSVARQNLISARFNLGRAIGLSENDSEKIGEPMDAFPAIDGAGSIDQISLDFLKELAHQNREDIAANQLSQKALELQMRLAENERKPQVDLLGVLNYGGTQIGNGFAETINTFTSSQGRDIGFQVGLRFDFPVNNNRAQGVYTQSKALLRDQEILTENLSRNIDINVAIALNNLKNSVDILQYAKKSLAYNEEVYKNEQTKFQNGLTTLLNLILFQERLTVSQIEYLRAQQQFALAIVSLRFETGTLYAYDNSDTGAMTFTPDTFYTIPSPN